MKPASKGGSGGGGHGVSAETEGPALAPTVTSQAQPSSPKTPKTRPSTVSGMVLRSGNTPGSASRTPRSRRYNEDSAALSLTFGSEFPEDMLNIEELVAQNDPAILDNFMMDFSELKDNTLFFTSSPGRRGGQPTSSVTVPGEQANIQMHMSGSDLSPMLTGKIMSPSLEFSRLRRTGVTPTRGQPSPRLGPFSPRPYHLRSASQSPAPTGYTPKHSDVTPFGLLDSSHFVSDTFFKPHSSAKRPLLTEAQLKLFNSPRGTKRSPSSLYESDSAKKPRREKKEKKDRRTATAPKRGEYRCGKCGFFPKKAKHNCVAEKQKKQIAGNITAGPQLPGSIMTGNVPVGGSGAVGATMPQEITPGQTPSAAAPAMHDSRLDQQVPAAVAATVGDPMLGTFGSGW